MPSKELQRHNHMPKMHCSDILGYVCSEDIMPANGKVPRNSHKYPTNGNHSVFASACLHKQAVQQSVQQVVQQAVQQMHSRC